VGVRSSAASGRQGAAHGLCGGSVFANLTVGALQSASDGVFSRRAVLADRVCVGGARSLDVPPCATIRSCLARQQAGLVGILSRPVAARLDSANAGKAKLADGLRGPSRDSLCGCGGRVVP
jgi:hypothetical protein